MVAYSSGARFLNGHFIRINLILRLFGLHLLPTESHIDVGIVTGVDVADRVSCGPNVVNKLFEVDSPHVGVSTLVQVMSSMDVQFTLMNKLRMITPPLWPLLLKLELTPPVLSGIVHFLPFRHERLSTFLVLLWHL